MIIYKTFTYNIDLPTSSNSNNEIRNNNDISHSNIITTKPVCCYISTYYNISYHSNGNQKFIVKSSKTANKKSSKKSSSKKSYKIHKHTQRDGSIVTIVKYKGRFYVFYDDELVI